MSISNGTIGAPVALSEPYAVLGLAPYNGVYDLGYACGNTHGRLNIWSANQPRWHRDYPSSFYTQRVEYTNKYMRHRNVAGGINEPYYLNDWIGYNHHAQPCRLNRISVTEQVYAPNQEVQCYFEYFTGEIDWRVYGATSLTFQMIVDGFSVPGQRKEVNLNSVPVNGIINNSGSEIFRYTYTANPGSSKMVGVFVQMQNNDGVFYRIDEAAAIMKMEKQVKFIVSYPTNIIYTYNGKWQTYAQYIPSLPKLPISSSTGQLYEDLQIPFNTTPVSVLNNFRNNVFFQLPNGRTVTYTFQGETPDQAATKVLMYKVLGGTKITWDPITDPYYVTVLG